MKKKEKSKVRTEEWWGDSLMSPIEGPPKQRRISAELPPSSETGSTKAGEGPKALANELAPVPPEMMM